MQSDVLYPTSVVKKNISLTGHNNARQMHNKQYENVSIHVVVENHSHKHPPDDHRKQDVVSIIFSWGT